MFNFIRQQHFTLNSSFLSFYSSTPMARNKKHAGWKGKKKPNPNPTPSTGYETHNFTTENKAFEAYYKVITHSQYLNNLYDSLLFNKNSRMKLNSMIL